MASCPTEGEGKVVETQSGFSQKNAVNINAHYYIFIKGYNAPVPNPLALLRQPHDEHGCLP